MTDSRRQHPDRRRTYGRRLDDDIEREAWVEVARPTPEENLREQLALVRLLEEIDAKRKESQQ